MDISVTTIYASVNDLYWPLADVSQQALARCISFKEGDTVLWYNTFCAYDPYVLRIQYCVLHFSLVITCCWIGVDQCKSGYVSAYCAVCYTGTLVGWILSTLRTLSLYTLLRIGRSRIYPDWKITQGRSTGILHRLWVASIGRSRCSWVSSIGRSRYSWVSSIGRSRCSWVCSTGISRSSWVPRFEMA